MAYSQISGVLIPCFVIQQNNVQYISDTGVIGQVRDVPCKNVFIDEVLYWCSPVKDEGIFSAVEFRLATGDNLAKPTYDSFLVQRVRDKLSNNTWWFFVNTSNDFLNSCNTCCGAASVPMPGVNGDFNPVFAPCQLVCEIVNGAGTTQAIFGIPTLPAGYNYYAKGSLNNVALPSSGSSFASATTLLTYLNANWTNVGSPNTTFIWTKSVDNLTLTATGGHSGDELCVNIYTILPSP